MVLLVFITSSSKCYIEIIDSNLLPKFAHHCPKLSRLIDHNHCFVTLNSFPIPHQQKNPNHPNHPTLHPTQPSFTLSTPPPPPPPPTSLSRMTTFFERFCGQTHHKGLCLFAGWGLAISSGIMYANYHPSLPPEPEDPQEFEKLVADIKAAIAEEDAKKAAEAAAH